MSVLKIKQNGVWRYVSVGTQGPKGDKGDPGAQGPAGVDGRSFTIKDVYATLAALRAAFPTGNEYAYQVTAENSEIFIWSDSENDWVSVGAIQGPSGKDGEDGYTPVKGVDYFDGQDGADGAPGKDGTSVTIANVNESSADGGSNVVTFSDGKTLTVKNGSKGSDGEDGYTPVKGVDYFTEADKTELVNAVLANFTDVSEVGM